MQLFIAHTSHSQSLKAQFGAPGGSFTRGPNTSEELKRDQSITALKEYDNFFVQQGLKLI